MRPSRVVFAGSVLLVAGILSHCLCHDWPLFHYQPLQAGFVYSDYWAPDPTVSNLMDYGGMVLTALGGILIVLAIEAQLLPRRFAR